MATEFCQKCKQSHPGQLCDYDEKGDCAETLEINEIGKASDQKSNEPNGKRTGN